MDKNNNGADAEAWAAIARPATAAEQAAEDAARASDAAMIFRDWGFDPPRLPRRWPTDGNPPAGTFEARERDLADAVDACEHASHTARRTGKPYYDAL